MKLVICIFFGVVIGFLTSKVKINIRYLDKKPNSFQFDFNVNLGWYLFGFLKIFGFTLRQDGIHILFWRISYFPMKMGKEQMKRLKEVSSLAILKSLHLRLDQFELNMKIGSEDMMLTVFSVFTISTFLSLISAKSRKQINLKHYEYKITPVYNTNVLSFEMSAKISMRFLSVLRTLKMAKKSLKNRKEQEWNVKKIPLKI